MRKSSHRKLFLVIGAAISLGIGFPFPCQASENNAWDQQWKDCRSLKLPIFQFRLGEVKEMIDTGRSWDSQVQLEIQKIVKIATVTCKTWAENPNGHEPLKEFTQQFSDVSKSALALQQQAKEELEPQLKQWWKTEAVELAVLGMKFDQFACGQSFQRAQKRVKENIKAIETGFEVLKKKCPQAADEVIAKARASGLPSTAKGNYGNGGPARVPASKSQNSQSDITGTKPSKSEAQP